MSRCSDVTRPPDAWRHAALLAGAIACRWAARARRGAEVRLRPARDARGDRRLGHRRAPGRHRSAAGPRLGRCRARRSTTTSARAATVPSASRTLPADRGRCGHARHATSRYATTGSKLDYATTLWDYINRAMPFSAPQTLTPDEVYALTAYVLHLNDILPLDAVLDRESLPKVKMPNRDGFTTAHGFMTRDGKPDTRNVACMRDCVAEVRLSSEMPDYARDQHGNLAEQTRSLGAVRNRAVRAPRTGRDSILPRPPRAPPATRSTSGSSGRDSGKSPPNTPATGRRKPAWSARWSAVAPARGARCRCRHTGTSRKPRYDRSSSGYWRVRNEGHARGDGSFVSANARIRTSHAGGGHDECNEGKHSRRGRHDAAVLLAAAGWLSPRAGAGGRRLEHGGVRYEVDGRHGEGAGRHGPVQSKDITFVQTPDIAENGAVVPIGVTSTIPKTESIAILVEKNPNMLVGGLRHPAGHRSLDFDAHQDGAELQRLRAGQGRRQVLRRVEGNQGHPRRMWRLNERNKEN